MVEGYSALKGPRPPVETMEGGSIDKLPKSPESDAKSVNEEANKVIPAKDTLLNIVSHSLQGPNLLAELHGKYELDPVFQPIIAKLGDFWNFEVDGQIVYLKRKDTWVLCIPKSSNTGT